ncbi:hypothetical protein [Viridibacillus arvi]|uniref:hypothetical protein n=1 Tax=Viridibacillus arvi TaxID=263475 RepID=UPI0034CEFD63
MKSVWHSRKANVIDDGYFGIKKVLKNPNDCLYFCEIEIEPIQVKTNYSLFKRKGLICHSIKLFFSGTLPDLSSSDFVREHEWYVFPHSEIAIFALPYGKDEWCFQIEKRNGFGVPIHALDVLPFNPQSEQLIWEGII